MSEKTITTTVERTVLVDDLTGDEMEVGGWMLTGARDTGPAYHFKSLTNLVTELLTGHKIINAGYIRGELERKGVL